MQNLVKKTCLVLAFIYVICFLTNNFFSEPWIGSLKNIQIIALWLLAILSTSYGLHAYKASQSNSAKKYLAIGLFLFISQIGMCTFTVLKFHEVIDLSTNVVNCKEVISKAINNQSLSTDIKHTVTQSCASTIYWESGKLTEYINDSGDLVDFIPSTTDIVEREHKEALSQQIQGLIHSLELQVRVFIFSLLAALSIGWFVPLREGL